MPERKGTAVSFLFSHKKTCHEKEPGQFVNFVLRKLQTMAQGKKNTFHFARNVLKKSKRNIWDPNFKRLAHPL